MIYPLLPNLELAPYGKLYNKLPGFLSYSWYDCSLSEYLELRCLEDFHLRGQDNNSSKQGAWAIFDSTIPNIESWESRCLASLMQDKSAYWDLVLLED